MFRITTFFVLILLYHSFVVDLTTFILPQFLLEITSFIYYSSAVRFKHNNFTTLFGRFNHIDFTTLLHYLIILRLPCFWYNTFPINILVLHRPPIPLQKIALN